MIVEIPTSSIGAVGLKDSEAYKRYKSDNKIKIVNAYCCEDAITAFLFVSEGGERKLINVELDVDFILNLKKSLNHGVIDKEVNDLYRKLTEKTE